MSLPNKGTNELGKFHTWMESDGIVRTVVKPNAEVLLQDAEQNTATVATFFNGKKIPLLVDIRNIKSISPDAREHFTLKGRESVVNAYALILSSSLSRMIGNFFMTFHKPAVPVRLFNHEDKALAWLKGFIQQP